MTNPYAVLGVSRSNTDDEIKSAYLNLVEKYSPVNYTGNPLSDLADKKLKEVNDAYDRIMAERRTGATYDSGAWENYGGQTAPPYSSQPDTSSQTSYQGTGNYTASLSRARQYLDANDLVSAEDELLKIPAASRAAEWNYLMGRLMQAKGWLQQANTYYAKAAELEPNNPTYSNAAHTYSARRESQGTNNPYNRSYNTGTSPGACGCSGCDICSSLICADCCCECAGGDLIRCC